MSARPARRARAWASSAAFGGERLASGFLGQDLHGPLVGRLGLEARGAVQAERRFAWLSWRGDVQMASEELLLLVVHVVGKDCEPCAVRSEVVLVGQVA